MRPAGSDWTPTFGTLSAGAIGAAMRAPGAAGERWAWVTSTRQGGARGVGRSVPPRGLHEPMVGDAIGFVSRLH